MAHLLQGPGPCCHCHRHDQPWLDCMREGSKQNGHPPHTPVLNLQGGEWDGVWGGSLGVGTGLESACPSQLVQQALRSMAAVMKNRALACS